LQPVREPLIYLHGQAVVVAVDAVLVVVDGAVPGVRAGAGVDRSGEGAYRAPLALAMPYVKLVVCVGNSDRGRRSFAVPAPEVGNRHCGVMGDLPLDAMFACSEYGVLILERSTAD